MSETRSGGGQSDWSGPVAPQTDLSLSDAGKPVIAAVDFSEDSAQALVWAARQATLEGAPLIVLHVVHDPAASPGFYRKPDEEWLRPMVEIAREMMDEFLARLKVLHPNVSPIFTAHTRFVTGLPAGRIVEVAGEIGARLIVIGSRGRTGLQSILLGSVAERVAQISAVPVVIVKTQSPETAPLVEASTGSTAPEAHKSVPEAKPGPKK